ncbi:PadR family transcriptional regulator [Sphingopyxis sp. RIFCSPHIGHO2_12_FULL_65_19]|uniref:PadR family transcriptional regulator n=1 Tax=Sphingopyxis sp. RIFCSPHIGHO2_12_FULL_65_19 TaxID=1802172 RepID=UPI000ACF9B91|nr:PadR family transcriptional regulator [Sphingopyxis sp. RIFCSPHIGHO2_12_FULL_65_19]
MIFYAKMEGRGCGGRHAMHRGGRGFGHGFGHGFGGGRRGGGGRGERGGRQRMFDSGELRLVLLKLIADEPRHGYDLIRQIEDLAGGSYAPSPGVIYPTLTLLDDMGLIDAQQSEGAKKLFAITDAGRAELDANSEIVEAALARLTAIGEETQRTDHASVRRAMGNLRQVLMNRLGDRDLDNAALHDIVALIDEAAQKIERL